MERKWKLVNIDNLEIQEERAPRLELSALPDELEARATGEKYVPASTIQIQEQGGSVRTQKKTSGLIVYFVTRPSKEFPMGQSFAQKYSKMSAKVLKDAMKKLKVGSTEEFQKSWFLYIKTKMDMGNDRLIPTKRMAD